MGHHTQKNPFGNGENIQFSTQSKQSVLDFERSVFWFGFVKYRCAHNYFLNSAGTIYLPIP